MESLIRLTLFILLTSSSFAAERTVGTLYFNEFMGHVHKNPSASSSSMTTLQCAHPIKILEDSEVRTPEGWMYVKVGDDKGFISSKFLTNKRPKCFQEKYPKFFINLNLDLSDMYYWGRLYDQYGQGESKIK